MDMKLKQTLYGVVINIGVLVGSDLSEWAPTRWGTVTVKKLISYSAFLDNNKSAY